MFRVFVALFVVCALLAPAGVLADEIRGTVKAVDSVKSTVTVTTEPGKDRTFDVAKDCRVTSTMSAGLRGRRTSVQTSIGIGAVSTGSSATVVTDPRGIVTEVRMEGTGGRGRRIAGLLPGR